MKMKRTLRKIWICNDVLMDILPFFDHAQLGLKLALNSPHFDALVDTHFDGKSELTIWRRITIWGFGEPQIIVERKSEEFPLPDRPLPSKIHFKDLHIRNICSPVCEFLRSNRQIIDKGTNLRLDMDVPASVQRIVVRPDWHFLVQQMLPIFMPNIRHLKLIGFGSIDMLFDILPTILSDLGIESVETRDLFPNVDWQNAIARKAVTEWLHIPSKDGQPKRLRCICYNHNPPIDINIDEWVNIFKEAFRYATTSVNFIIHLKLPKSTPIEQFEFVNEQTNEQLTLLSNDESANYNNWVMKRCQIGQTATAHWEDRISNDLNNVNIEPYRDIPRHLRKRGSSLFTRDNDKTFHCSLSGFRH